MEQRRRSILASGPGKTVCSSRVSSKSLNKLIFSAFASSLVLLLLFFTFSVIKLPAASDNGSAIYPNPKRLNKRFLIYRNAIAVKESATLGGFGEIMVGMLADDLPFTVFVPSENDFRRILGASIDAGTKIGNFTRQMLVNSTSDNVMAIISRILGFSAVPSHLPSKSVPLNGELIVESLSGFRLQLARVSNGILVVNNVSCEVTDRRRAQTIVHVVRGVIMDAEFEQSVKMEDEDLE
eukprot:Gb_06021 [translate_table: standard]